MVACTNNNMEFCCSCHRYVAIFQTQMAAKDMVIVSYFCSECNSFIRSENRYKKRLYG